MACVYIVRAPRQESYEADYDFLLGQITKQQTAIGNLTAEIAQVKQQLARVLSAQNVTATTGNTG